MTHVPINPGDWLIRQSRFGYDVAQAERTSKVLVWLVAGSGGSYTPSRAVRDDVLYVGTEVEVRAVLEKLESSKALRNSEQRNAEARHRDRVAKLTRPTP